MSNNHNSQIAQELNIRVNQVNATVDLLDGDSTVPFIARYRKEATGNLDEVLVTKIRDRLQLLRELDKRRATVLQTIKQQGKLTKELEAKIRTAETMTVLEDLYLPYRPKRRTRATIAKEKGLEPLAKTLFAQKGVDLNKEAEPFADEKKRDKKEDEDKRVKSIAEALAGARDIIAEWINEDSKARAELRILFEEEATIQSKVLKGKEEAGQNYKDYFQWQEMAKKTPSHRILATRRGEKEKILSISITVPETKALAILEKLFVKGQGEDSNQVKMAAEDSFKRLLSISLGTELRLSLKKRADEEAIDIFKNNLYQLLMASPMGQKNVLAIDPGFRTGCKAVCLDRQGKLLKTETLYIFGSESQKEKSGAVISNFCEEFDIEVIAIGNGTASRETESFIRAIGLPQRIMIVMVSETGASVYSASEAAREEFPDYDITVRGAVSIGRRLMDPLAELVKIDPKSIGVGQYQHDVDQKQLKLSLDDTVMSCVNQVGVEINTASKELLTYVSGLGPSRAQLIIDYRNANGRFSDRNGIREITGLGPKAFEQSAGFLRICDGKNLLDASAVHPESYEVVETMVRDLGCTIADLMQQEHLVNQITLEKYVSPRIGLPTLVDIKAELAKPGRDPREPFQLFTFKEEIQKIEDLTPGMKLPAVITNITAFGAFADIGVHHDGLIHISQLSDRYIKDPQDVVKVHQKVEVTVLEIDLNRKRIALTMRSKS